MKADLRRYTEEQRKTLERLGEKVAYKVTQHWKLWSKPMKAKVCINTLSKSLSLSGINHEEFRIYLEEENYAKLGTTIKNNVELVFPAHCDEATVYQGLVDFDNEAFEEQDLRRQMRKEAASGVRK